MDSTHEPFFLENPAGGNLVIFIHGFMGSPRQFDKLAEAAAEQGYSAAALLLPGHGCTAREFASGTFKQWQEHVNAEVERFSHDYDNIRLVGHSMGGLLAINAAVKYPGIVRGIFTIACPFKLTLFSSYALKIRLKQLFGKKDDPAKIAYISNSSINPSISLMWRILKPKAELKALMAAANNNLLRVSVPVTAVYSSSDELTSIESLGIFSSGLSEAPFEQVLLSDSLHSYFTENEFGIIRQSLLKAISRR